MLDARTPAEQRAAFERIDCTACSITSRSSCCRNRLYRSTRLGIPPAQYDELVASSDGDAIAVLRERVEKLACDFPIKENYFAWQAFARGYDIENREAVPAYLRTDIYEAIRTRTDRVEVHHASLIDFLKSQRPNSLHRYVLLDAQDWMTPDVLTALWPEIDRTADTRDARVIFRTAGRDSPCRANCRPTCWRPGNISKSESRAFHAKDRSSIYGGFHVYHAAACCR